MVGNTLEAIKCFSKPIHDHIPFRNILIPSPSLSQAVSIRRYANLDDKRVINRDKDDVARNIKSFQ